MKYILQIIVFYMQFNINNKTKYRMALQIFII